MARAWLGDVAEVQSHPYYRRLFPGCPALIAALHAAGLPLDWAALLPSWLAVGPVAVACALYFRDRRLGWAMAALTPAYILTAAFISAEALGLLLVLAGLWRARRDDALGTGLLLGLSILTSPVAAFPFLGCLAFLACRKCWRGIIITALSTGLVVAAGFLVVAWRFGDAFQSLRHYPDAPAAYAGAQFTWPFAAILTAPQYPGARGPVTHPQMGYVWLHVLVMLIGCLLAFVRWRSQADRPARALPALMALWLIGHTAGAVCLAGPNGFSQFPRVIIPALPPLFWAYRDILPRRAWVWLIIGVLGLALAYPAALARLM